MKTRDEIQKELAHKKQAAHLSKEILEVKTLFKTFLSDFKAVNLKLEHSRSLKDEDSLKELKNAIERIPKEFRIKHTTEKVSYTFLWKYFVASMICIFLSIGYGIQQHYKYSDVPALEQTAFLKGKKQGYQEVFETLPESSQQYLKKKHPDVFKSIK